MLADVQSYFKDGSLSKFTIKTEIKTVWPQTSEDDWCGEFEPNDQTQQLGGGQVTPEWLEEVVETIGLTDGVDLVKWHQDKAGDYIVAIKYGEEEMSFRAGTDGLCHGQDYDGTIFDLTTTDQVQWWCAGELYTRLQRAKRKIKDLEANASVMARPDGGPNT